MDQIYRNGVYEQTNPTWHEEDAPWKAGQIHKILVDNKVSFDSLCEVGCGTGRILANLVGKFPQATFSGYEISPQAFERATQMGSSKIEFRLKDPFQEPRRHFDVVMAIDVIEHVEDYIGFITNLKQIGRLKVFHIPLDLSVQSLTRMSPILRMRQTVGHIHYFTKDIALAALSDCGYKIVDWRYTASRLELPNQALSSRIVAAPRRWLHRVNADLTVRILGGYSLLVLAE
jgi:cyclopropane fatty-acyl-phospholipid synthase-like methyltransferase